MEKRKKSHIFSRKKGLLLIMFILFSTTLSFAQWSIDEGFEDGVIPADWTIYDVNEDGHQWIAFESTTHAHSGEWIAAVDCYDSDGEDWLITPPVTIQDGDSFIFFAKAWYDSENMNVMLSTSGNSIGDFDVTLESVTGLGDDYVEFEYDLSPYTGETIYLAFHWIQDTYALVVDDVKVGQAEPNDVGMVSIEVPEGHHFLDSEIYPTGTIMNYGTSDITEDFDVNCEIRNEDAEVVYNSTFIHTGTLIPDETEEITFTDLWIPDEIGTYYVSMITDLIDDANTNNDGFSIETEIVIHYGTGGPDDFGYQWIDSEVEGGPVYDWIEISETGESAIMYGVDQFYGDDNFSEPIEFGFDFPFYGIPRTYFHVDVNGSFLLAENTWYNHYPTQGWGGDGNIFNYSFPIPGYTQMPALVAIYWDDLHADEGIGDIYFQTFGEAPDRYCVVEWHNVRFHAGTGGDPTLCFEAIFHENGEIIFQYQNVANGQTGSTCPHDNGASSTIAIQNDTADIGLCYLREIVENQQYIGVEPLGNLLTNELAIRFYSDPNDVYPPAFVYEEEAGNTFDNTPELAVAISDMSGILSDELFYNTGSGWESVAHSYIEESNIYHYELPEIPNNTTVNYYFSAMDNSENQNTGTLPENAPTEYFSFKVLPTANIDILLAHPGTTPGYQDYNNIEFPKYIEALDGAGVNYDIYNWAEFEDYAFPEQYEAIFVYSNSSSGSDIHDILSYALMDYMDSGTETNPKNVFMASDGWANSQHGSPNSDPRVKFYSAYLRGGYHPQGTYGYPPYGGTNGLGGPDCWEYEEGSVIEAAGSPIGIPGAEAPVYANSPDVLYPRSCPDWYAEEVTNPEISSSSSLLFEDGPGPLVPGQAYCYHGTCGFWLDNLIYKSFYTSFDFSQFTEANDRQEIINNALNWFEIDTAIDNPEISIPNKFALNQNYPNPFIISGRKSNLTTIQYNLPQQGKVTLDIFNIKGQKVKKLVDDILEKGQHSASWNGKDENNKQVSSGIYFYKLDTTNHSSTKKMILIEN